MFVAAHQASSGYAYKPDRVAASERPAEMPAGLPRSREPLFLLGLNSVGLWVIRESTGAKAGIFRTRQAAIRYAKLESPDENYAIIFLPNGLEFPSVVRANLCAST